MSIWDKANAMIKARDKERNDAWKRAQAANTPAPLMSSGLSELQLNPWGGPTEVDLTKDQKDLLSLLARLISGEEGRYKEILSGRPDMGQLEHAVLGPARRELTQQTLPQIADIYSSGPYGAGYNTGARQGAQERAAMGLVDLVGKTRFAADESAKDRALTAQNMLPAMMGVEDIVRQNNIQNLERTIGVHYKNQGLSMDEFNADLAATQMAINEAYGKSSLSLQERQLDLQSQALQAQLDALSAQQSGGMLGTIGSLLGAGAGAYFGGPAGMALGSQLGGALGQGAGGYYPGSYAGIQNIMSYPSLYNYYSMSQLYPQYNQNSLQSLGAPQGATSGSWNPNGGFTW